MEPEGTQEVQVPDTTPIVSPPSEKEGSSGNKVLVIFIIVILILLAGAAAYFFGVKSRSSEEAIPTPTPEEALSTPTPFEEISTTPGATTNTPTPKPSASPTPTVTSQTMTLNSTSSLDGFRSNNNGGNNTLDIRAGNGSMVGSPSYELVSRGFVSFDIPSSLNGKTIEKVTLRMYQRSVTGTPYGTSNNLVVDHIDYGNTLEAADYDKSPIASDIGALSPNAVVQWKDLDVTSSFNNDLTNSRSRSQYRIRFATETDGDGSEDFTYFDSANPGYNTNTPQLVVKYH